MAIHHRLQLFYQEKLRAIRSRYSDYLIGFFLVLGGAVFFSLKAVFIKKAYNYGITPTPLLCLRMVFATPFFLFILVWAIRAGELKAAQSRDIAMTLLLGTAGYYLSSWLDFLGLQYVSVGLERLTLFLYPSFVLLFSYLFFKVPIQLKQIRALCCCYLGLVLAFTSEMQWSTTPGQTALGTFFVTLAAVIYALYIMGNGIYVLRLGTIGFTAIAMLSAAFSISLHYGLFYSWKNLLTYPWPVYGYSFCIAFFSTVLPALMVSAGIKRIGAGTSSIISSIGPVISILLGVVFLAEPFSWLQGMGIAAVIVGVVSLKNK